MQTRNNYPTFTCPNCDRIFKLTFFPLRSKYKWAHFKCPFCLYNSHPDYANELILIEMIKVEFKLEDYMNSIRQTTRIST
jgi:predicted RNA-binding Zn-ribbon protein involved in translation (DUF1610 family)